MANSETHFIFSAGASMLKYLVSRKQKNQEITIPEILGVGICGGVAGILPDIIEPADNPNHRSFAHSVSVGTGLVWMNKKLKENPNLSDKEKDFLDSVITGYLVHLVLDGTTPKSLPLIT